MILFFKLLILLWFINFAPLFAAMVLGRKWERPIDFWYTFADGQPLFGNHKTLRGLIAGICAGLFAGILLGLPSWVGLGAGALSMMGDLFSSFLKRRLSFSSGDVVPGLDQLPEGLFPFLLLVPYFSLSPRFVIAFVVIFALGAYFGSVFLNQVLLRKPYSSYPRKVCPTTRFRELISCQITSRPLRYMLNFEDAFYYHIFMKSVFRVFGVYERGQQNALNIQSKKISFDFSDLPPAFDGYRILFLTDLHLDGLQGLTERVIEIVQHTPADLCVLGGDYRMDTYGPFSEALSLLNKLLPEIQARDGIVALLGNHDCIEIVGRLREAPVTFLVNESAVLRRDDQELWLVGVDDPHYFACHNLEQAFQRVPRTAFSIFLSHTNEVYKEAREYSPKLYLCGHCHGGQVCLSSFGPIFTHSKAPRYMCAGRWDYRGMQGYTSKGVGVSGVPVRFNTRGEVTLITLRRK